jgi:hypothetical protein
MRSNAKRWLTGFAVVLATMAVAAPAAAVTPVATAAPVTHRTVFATKGGTLYRLALSSTGAVTASTPVAGGTNSVASDYDGARLAFVRQGAPDWRDDQVWVREAAGESRFLAMGHLGTFTPERTGVTIARYVMVGRDPDSMDPHHDELSVYRLADGHVLPLSPHADAYSDLRMRNSHDGKNLWMLTLFLGESDHPMKRYDRATDTITRSFNWPELWQCGDVEILPSGANALFACGSRLLTMRLDTGAITHSSPLPAGTTATALDGRLNTQTLLLSMSSGSRRSLAALDLTTMQIRTLAGSAGYTDAVAAY